MPRPLHAATLLAALLAAGCGDPAPTTPNTDLKVPDIKPGRGADATPLSGKPTAARTTPRR